MPAARSARLRSMSARVARALSRAGEHELSGRAAQIAFYTLLAIFPAILALLGLLALLDLQSAALPTLEALTRRGLPPNHADLILDQIHALDERHGFTLVVTVVMTLYYGAQALGAVLSGVALAFDRTEHHPLRAALLGLGLTGALLLVLPVLLSLLTVGSWLLSWAAAQGLLGAGLSGVAALVRWPLLCLAFQQAALGMYRLGAARAVARRGFSPGSLLAAVGWMAITMGFEFFVGLFSDLGATYGSLGAVIGLMLYVHLVASTLMLGAEVDALRVLTRQTGPAPAA